MYISGKSAHPSPINIITYRHQHDHCEIVTIIHIMMRTNVGTGDDGCHEFHPLTKCNHQSSIARAPSWPSSKWASSSLSSSWSVPSSFWWSSYFAKWRYQWFVEYCPVIYATNKRYWAQNHIIKIKILHADLFHINLRHQHQHHSVQGSKTLQSKWSLSWSGLLA